MPKLMFCDCRVIETVNLLRACISEWSSALSALTVSVLTTGGTGAATAADDDVADEPSLADTSPSSPPPPSPTKLGSDDRRDEVAPLAEEEEEEEEDGSLGVLLLDLLSNAFCLIWVSIKSFES
jgi:hypothetical protein